MRKCLFFVFIFPWICFSCNTEEEEQIIIRLCSVIEQMSRSLNIDEQTTNIAAGQIVGVTILGANQEHINVPWISQIEGNMVCSQEGPLYFDGSKSVQIVAYQPYNLSWVDLLNNSYKFSTIQDQSAEGYTESDLLWTCQNEAPAASIRLNFHHLMSKIVINLSSETIREDLIGARIYISNVCPDVDVCGGQLGQAYGDKIDICLGNLDESLHACGVLVPQICEEGLTFVRVLVGDNVYTYKLPNQKEFKSGFVYTYNLNVIETDPTMKVQEVNTPDYGHEYAWN